jgi:hypothetical protein
LAARILGLQEEWGHDATFAYVDRWMVEDHGSDRSGSGFIDAMWAKYRQGGTVPGAKKPEAPRNVQVN